MSTPHQSHAAMLQLIAEGMRSPAAERLSASQLDRIAGLLDRIAVDLLLPSTVDDAEPASPFALEVVPGTRLHS